MTYALPSLSVLSSCDLCEVATPFACRHFARTLYSPIRRKYATQNRLILEPITNSPQIKGETPEKPRTFETCQIGPRMKKGLLVACKSCRTFLSRPSKLW